VAYKVHLKSAKKYTGISELDLLLKAQRPRVQQSAREAGGEHDEEESDKEEDVAEQVEEVEDECSNEVEESDDSGEEWQDDSTTKVKKVDYFSATQFTSSHHQWLCGFFKYLHSPLAGYKKLENRLQHVGQVQKLL